MESTVFYHLYVKTQKLWQQTGAQNPPKKQFHYNKKLIRPLFTMFHGKDFDIQHLFYIFETDDLTTVAQIMMQRNKKLARLLLHYGFTT